MNPTFETVDTTCPGCGKPGLGYCGRKCQHDNSAHSARDAKLAASETIFVGVDGEGITVDGVHRYVMLSVGDVTLWRGGRDLTHTDVFPFLYEQYQDQTAHWQTKLGMRPRVAFVGFYLGYDFTRWVRSLSASRGTLLFNAAMRKRKGSGGNPTPFPVYVGGWDIDILGLRRFKLRPHACPSRNDVCWVCGAEPGEQSKAEPWMYVCDTGSYFQAPFLTVIHPDNWADDKPCTLEEYETIQIGKGNRDATVTGTDTTYYADMQRYNTLENRVLARAMTILDKGFRSAGVKLNVSEYYGPGQAVQRWLDIQVKSGRWLSHKQIESVVPGWALEAFRDAYYGGRFEIAIHGHIPTPVTERDIVSAYPDAMRRLPCLCSSYGWSWGDVEPPSDADIVLLYGRFHGSNSRLGGLPLRTKQGRILYPHHTAGWYLQSEVEAAHTAGLIDSWEVRRWVAYKQQCDHEPPLTELATLFTLRQSVGKATPYGVALKLLLNSCYGKFAQSIGTPKYANPVYASMITSHTRTLILDAIAKHPDKADAVAMIATDGIYFLSPHPEPTGSKLGDWEQDIRRNMCLMKPGVYWDDATRQGGKFKARGISAAAMRGKIPTLDRAFNDMRTSLDNGDATNTPEIHIEAPFAIISPQLALHRGKWELCGHVEWNIDRIDRATLAPKRERLHVADGMMRSHPMTVGHDIVSVPYPRMFGFAVNRIEDELYTPDGHIFDDGSRDL